MADTRKLGKLPPKHDFRTLRFAKYAKALLPAPVKFDYTNRLNRLGILANDTLGDCTAAGVAHLHQAWAAYNGFSFIPTDAETVEFYSKSCGYVIGDPATDNGGALLDVLKYWKTNGYFGHTIEAYAAVAGDDAASIKQAIYYFGGLYMGIALPKSAQNQDVWDVPWYGQRGPGAFGSWGGHCVSAAVGYDEDTVTVITWGALKKMTWNFFKTYCDEAYAVLSPDWYGTGVAPTGFDAVGLRADIAAIS